METFSALLALFVGNLPATGEFPSQRPVTRSFDVFCDLRLNKRFSKQPRAGGLRCIAPSLHITSELSIGTSTNNGKTSTGRLPAFDIPSGTGSWWHPWYRTLNEWLVLDIHNIEMENINCNIVDIGFYGSYQPHLVGQRSDQGEWPIFAFLLLFQFQVKFYMRLY